MSPTFLQRLSLIGLAIVLFSVAPAKGQDAPRRGGQTTEQRVAALTQRLALSEAQQAQLRAVLAAQPQTGRPAQGMSPEDVQAMRRQRQQQQAALDAAIEAILTPAQVGTYRAYRAQQQGRMGQGAPMPGTTLAPRDTTGTPRAASQAGAQRGTLVGTVADAETGEPLPYASVTVRRPVADSTVFVTGGLTDDEGAFRLEGVRAGTYTVMISYVSYASKTITGVRVGEQPVGLGTVRLNPEGGALSEVEVVTERRRMAVELDRTTYDVANDPVVQGGSATDALEQIPSVEVDFDGNISLRGTSNVAVYINGRPAPVSQEFIAAYLRGLPAGVIDKIEVMPNPSAAFEPEAMGGVLNIVLKQNVELGISTTVVTGADTKGGYNGTATVAFGRGPLSLSAAYGLRRNVRDSESDRFSINRYQSPNTYLNQLGTTDRAGLSHLLSLSGEYQIRPQTMLTGSAQLALQNDDGEDWTRYEALDAAETPTFTYDRVGTADGDGQSFDVRLGFRHRFDGARQSGEGTREQGGFGERRGGHGGRGGWGGGGRGGDGGGSSQGGHALSAEVSVDASTDRDFDTFAETLVSGTGALRPAEHSGTERKEREADVRVDYTRPLAIADGGTFQLGYRGSLRGLNSEVQVDRYDAAAAAFVRDEARSSTYDLGQTSNAVYAQTGATFGSLGVQVGLRAEHTRQRFTPEDAQYRFDRTYFNLFPSAFVTYKIGLQNVVRANYGRRVSQPRTFFLDPTPSYADPLNLQVGNPDLKPEFTDAFEVGYTRYTPWGSLAGSAYARRTTDVIRRYQEVRADGVTVSTFANLAERSSYGVELTSSFNGRGALAALRGSFSVEGYRQLTDGATSTQTLQSDAFSWGGRANATYAVRNGTDVQASVRYRAPIQTEQGRQGAMTFFDVALRQRLLDGKGNLALRARDPFGLATFSGTIDQAQLFQQYSRTMGGPQVGVTFTYTFGRTQERRQQPQQEPDTQSFDEIAF
jgi:iron complex outermembrane recepter protein